MILQVKNIYKAFYANNVLTGCSFDVEEGSISALIGPNGAGKSTVFDIITGFTPLDRGSVLLNGQKLINLKPYKIGRLGISRTFQKVRLFKNLTMLDHLIMAQHKTDDSLSKNLLPKSDAKSHISKAKSILEELLVEKNLEQTLVTDLSYGQKKLLNLTMAILKPHKLLMLDEPVAGVNQVIRKIIIEKIKREAQKGDTILLIEHDMHFISKIADVVHVLDAGKVIAKGNPEDIKKNEQVISAYLGD